jgi:pimeloyl-ACP methyl ester carboxylesterase
MERATIDDIELEYELAGTGEPVVFIHGAFIVDTCRPLLTEPALADRYRLILYRRRGYAGSAAPVMHLDPASRKHSGCCWPGCRALKGSSCQGRRTSCGSRAPQSAAAWQAH